ncbi:Outer dense fiber protein 3 [Sparganum proliferum]
MFTSPGPVYMLPGLTGESGHDIRSTHEKAPGYSFGKVLHTIDHVNSPGPAAYAQNSKLANTGDTSGPKYTMAPRTEPLDSNIGPGPAKYYPSVKQVFPRQPEYNMGLKLNDVMKNNNPAPNAYSMPTPDIVSQNKSAPKYTLASRLEGLTPAKNPGPADYTVGSPDLVMDAAPKYSMGAHLTGIKPHVTPGPDAYRSEDCNLHLPRQPKFTMGIYHSPYRGEFDAKYYDDN